MKQRAEHWQIEKDAIERLHDLLVRVPFLNVSQPILEAKLEQPDFQVDALLSIKHGKRTWHLVVEVKSNAQLRDARHSVYRLLHYAKAFGEQSYPVFVSQYLTPSVRAFCSENGVGYFDFSGNCRIVFDDVFIEREVPSSETPERKRLKSLFSPKSTRVIRRLLHDPRYPWKSQQLAEASEVSAATVSLIKDKLLGEEYAARQGEAFIITKPENLLMDWTRQYDSNQHKQIECYGTSELDELESRFVKYCEQHSIDYAFTMFSGARRVAPFTRGVQRAYAYVASSTDPMELAYALNLKPVDSGGNFRLITPADDDLLFDKQVVAGSYVVSDIQLYLDLAGHQGRGEENAEFLLEQRIRPRW